ncbi:hypothetical protein KY331_02685 [Candidatus Woesearchaeota archaeon]|nr:hypothetical protein [Candidatus Woesearchaeota archaeon]
MGQHYISRGIIEPVTFFVNSLGRLPEGSSSSDYKNSDERFNAKLREDVRKVTDFHPQVDPQLTDITLEQAIAFGLDQDLIEFFKGVKGITAERCYQIMQQEGISLPDLSDPRILEVNEGVHTDYVDNFPFSDEAADRRTERAYEPLRKGVKAVIEFAKSLLE